MKALTVPKLELKAALLASRLREEIFKALTVQINCTLMWADSTTVLQWLNSLEKQPIFVANRVSEIPEGTTVNQWHPADIGTRGMSSEAFQNSAGLRGQYFLRTSDCPFYQDSEVVSNIKFKRHAAYPNPSDNCSALQANCSNSGLNVSPRKYSSSPKHLRIFAYVIRILHGHFNYRSIDENTVESEHISASRKETAASYLSRIFPDRTYATPRFKKSIKEALLQFICRLFDPVACSVHLAVLRASLTSSSICSTL